MKHKWTRATSLALMVLFGTSLTAEAEISLPLQPGYAVHTMGMSPVETDGNATLRIYDTNATAIFDRSVYASNGTFNNDTYTTHLWDIGSLGNVYGIAIDKNKNIYVTASASWSPGYLGAGTGDDLKQSVTVGYGAIGAGISQEIDDVSAHDEPVLNDLNASGAVYKIDGQTGAVTVFARLPQVAIEFTNQVCEGADNDVARHTGPGLGNIVYDKFHNQFFVSNFSDGNIYRIDSNGNVDREHPFDTGLGGMQKKGAPYGLAISPDGKKLYYGTQEVNYHPQVFSVELAANGKFAAGSQAHDESLMLGKDLQYTQNIGGSHTNKGVWAAYSDLDFTPDGDLVLGVRVGCKDNFATSYNHGGVSYLLSPADHGWTASSQVPGSDDINYTGTPTGTNDEGGRSGGTRYDKGAIPMRADGADTLATGPDDGYGGVAVWQKKDGSYDFFLTSGDINKEQGVHGFMRLKGDFEVTDGKLSAGSVAAFRSTKTALDDIRDHDYKGIGGDVEVLSVVPVSIGSCVWLDKNKDGIQDDDEPGIGDVELALYDKEGNKVATTKTKRDCTYEFTGLAEGDYRVCVTGGIPVSSNNTFRYLPTKTLSTGDNNDSESDSNFVDGNCSGYYSLFVGTEPTESGDYRGDNQDNAHDTWGNMTVDFGYVKNVFDLALKKVLAGDPDHKYKIGETVQFKITVKNQGNVDATNVVVKDTLPQGLELNDSRWGSNGTITIASIEAGKEAVVEINCTVTKEAGEQGSLINVAEIAEAHNQYDLNDTDSVPGQNPCGTDMDNDNVYDGNTTGGCDDVDPAKIIIDQNFDLALVKKVKGTKGTYKRGEKVTFVVTVYNQGTVTGKDIQIKDDIPEGLEFVADDNWTLSGTDAVLKTPIPSLAPGAYVTREIVFKIKTDFKGDKITNIAEIEGAKNDLNLSDDDSEPGVNPCGADMGNNNDINSTNGNANGCDDVDPAWITVDQPQAVGGATESKSGTGKSSGDCDCAGVQGNKVDAMSTWMMVLMILSIVMIGFLQSRERTVE